jgi:hypothetical protein
MRAEKVRVEANRCNPARDKPSILPGGHAAVVIATATEQIFARFLASGSDVIVDGLSRLLRQPKSDGPTGLLLPTVARSTAYPLGATSSTRSATTSQPRSLLSIARLNIAKSRVHPAICNRVRIDHTCFGPNGGFRPITLPLFQGSRRSFEASLALKSPWSSS